MKNTEQKQGVEANNSNKSSFEANKSLRSRKVPHLDSKSILLIEWPESVSGGLPEPDLTIKIEVEGFSRRIQINKNVVK